MANTRERTTKTSQRWLDSLILTTHTKRIDPSMPVNFDHAQHWLISGFVAAPHTWPHDVSVPAGRGASASHGKSAGTESQRSHRGASTTALVMGKLPPIFGSMFAMRTISSTRYRAPRRGWRIMNGRCRILEKTKQTKTARERTHAPPRETLRERTQAPLNEGANVRARFRLHDL